MGDQTTKSGVAITCMVKTALDKTLAADMKKFITDRIESCVGKSKKLEVDANTKSGFSFDATLELTKDDKSKPVQIKGKLSFAIMSVGLTPSTVNSNAAGFAEVGANPKYTAAQVKDLVSTLLDKLLPNAFKAMESRAP